MMATWKVAAKGKSSVSTADFIALMVSAGTDADFAEICAKAYDMDGDGYAAVGPPPLLLCSELKH